MYPAQITDARSPVRLSTGPITFNASRGRSEFRARLVKAGRIRNADNSPGSFIIPRETLVGAADGGLFDGLAVFADHPGVFQSPSVKALIGVTYDSFYNAATDGVEATIRFYADESKHGADGRLASTIVDTLRMMLRDRQDGIEPPDIGLSIVFWPEWEETQPGEVKTLRNFRKIDSADIVFGPAADGRILEALSTYRLIEGGIPMSEPRNNHHPAVEDTIDSRESQLAGASRVGTQSPAGYGQPAAGNQQPASLADAWTGAMQQSAVPVILSNSGLPAISQDKLRRQTWDSPEHLQQAIREEREYLSRLAEQNVIGLYGGPPRSPGAGNITMQTGMAQIENAVQYLFGVEDAKTPEPQLRRLDAIYAMLTGDYEFHGVFRPDRVYLAAATTTTLANMAVNAMNKVVQAQLALLTHYRWYERIARPTPNDGSLHDMQWISFGGIDVLPAVSEGGAYDELTVDDVKEADSFAKYGGYVGITRKMIKNSDIQRIQAVPKALAAASVKTRSSKIAAIFTANSGQGPVLDQDSKELFKSDNSHSNYATTALGTDTTAWKAAAIECFKQTEVNSGNRIGVFPKYCLVPPDLYHTALGIFGYGDGVPTSYQPFAQERGEGDPRPVPIAVPDWTDGTDWAYITDPMVWPVIHMSFSADPSGRTFPAPELWAATSETGGLLFASDVLPIKVRDEFAYGVNGYKGIGKRVVA
ncbi:MAG: hypothetical protein ACK2UH_05670 [Candidatus Promineifilaceae bacterium]